jgi:hypothetical protein
MGRIGKRTKTLKLLLINSYSLGVTTCCLTNKNDVVSEHEALIYSPFKEGVVFSDSTHIFFYILDNKTIVYRPIIVPPVFYLLICLTDFMFVLVITIANIQLT